MKEHKFHEFTKTLRSVVYFIDTDNVIVSLNDAYEVLTGIAATEMIGKKFEEAIEPSGREKARQAFALSLKGKASGVEIPLLNRRGREVWVIGDSQVWNEDGIVKGMYGIAVDISAQKATAYEEHKYRYLFENSKDFLGLATLDGKGLYLNQAGCDLVGLSDVDEARQHSIEEYIPDGYRDHRHNVIIPTVKDKGSWRGITGLRHFRDGHTIPVESSIFTICDPDTGEAKWLGTIQRDISERLANEKIKRETETQFRSLFETMTEGVALHKIVYDKSGKPVDYKVLDVNPAYYDHTGIRREAAAGQLASKLYGTGVAPYLDIYSQVVATGEPHSFEVYFSPLDKHFSIKVCAQGEALFATIFEDITEDKKTAQSLQQSETRYRNILAAIPDLMFRFDRNGVFLDYHAASSKDLYLPPEQFLGKKVIDVLPKPLAELTANNLAKAFATGKPLQYEYSILLQEQEHYYEARMIPSDNETTLVMIRDITKRKQAEDKLLERDAALAQAQATAHLGSWEQNLTTGETIWSDELYRIYGVSQHDQPNPHYDFFLSLVHPDDRKRVDRIMQQTLKNMRFPDTEYRVVRPDGRELRVFTRGEIICDINGKILKLFGSSQDVTEWKITEDKLRQANKELKSLDEMKTNLLSNVSHELRTPLVSVRGYTEMIVSGRSGAVNELQVKQLNISLRNIDRLLVLIDKLLSFSRMEMGVEDLMVEDYELGQLVTESVATMLPKTTAKKIDISVVMPDEKITLRGDRGKIYQVLTNIVDNAIKFSHPDGKIEIKAALASDDWVEVIISDNGIGMAEDELKVIFNRFYQVDSSSSRRYGGIGIGLSICQDIIDMHNGTITVQSTKGKGTTFTLSLPRHS